MFDSKYVVINYRCILNTQWVSAGVVTHKLRHVTFAESTLLYACPDSHIGLGKVYPGAYTTTGELLVSTSPELGKLIQLRPFEVVLEVGILVP